MKYKDENGKEGRYSGDVNDDHQPHGQGKMKYKDGTVFLGVWSEGSQVHGKTTSGGAGVTGSKPSGKSSGSSGNHSDWARAAVASGAGGPKTVRKMKWMDYYGDPGEYTGEVDSRNMPHGKGAMKYDHGLIQEGLWNKGQFVEGSDVEGSNGGVVGGRGGSLQKSGQRSAQQTPPRSRSSRHHEGGSKSKPSVRSSSSKGLDP